MGARLELGRSTGSTGSIKSGDTIGSFILSDIATSQYCCEDKVEKEPHLPP